VCFSTNDNLFIDEYKQISSLSILALTLKSNAIQRKFNVSLGMLCRGQKERSDTNVSLFSFRALIRIKDPLVFVQSEHGTRHSATADGLVFSFKLLTNSAFATTKNEKPVSSKMKRVFFVTSSGETSNFLWEDMEDLLKIR